MLCGLPASCKYPPHILNKAKMNSGSPNQMANAEEDSEPENYASAFCDLNWSVSQISIASRKTDASITLTEQEVMGSQNASRSQSPVEREKIIHEMDELLHVMQQHVPSSLQDQKMLQLQRNLEKEALEKLELKHKLCQTEQKLSAAKKSNAELKKMLENGEKMTNTEREDLQAEMNRLSRKLNTLETQLCNEQANNKRSESNLHAFYQSQMEAILSEKIQILQSHVIDMENNLVEERKQEELKYRLQTEKMKQRFADEMKDMERKFIEQRESFESLLIAARQEADCVREQLKEALKLYSTEVPSSAFFNRKSNLTSVPDVKMREQRVFSLHRIPVAEKSVAKQNSTSPSTALVDPSSNVLLNNTKQLKPKDLKTQSSESEEITPQNIHLKPFQSLPLSTDSEKEHTRLTRFEKEEIIQKFLDDLKAQERSFVVDKDFMENFKVLADKMINETVSRLNSSVTETSFLAVENDLSEEDKREKNRRTKKSGSKVWR